MASDASSPVRRTLVTSLKILLYASIVTLIALLVAVVVAMGQLPSYQELARRNDLGQMIRVHGANNEVILTLGPSFGEWLPYDQIPPIMRQAMVAVEDKRFRSHIGVDPIGVARALQVRATRGHWTQGGSTITQQLARNIFLSNNRTFGRKMKEAVLALAIERRFSKDQILELYLNRVYFGGGAFGIDAASRRFFGHSARTLSVAEAAIIAGLVKAPSNYSPSADAEAARARAATVIQLMLQNGDITPSQAYSAEPAKVQLAVAQQQQNSVRYFTDWVLPQLDTLIDRTSQPIDVWTTIDLGMQRAGDAAINANSPDGAQGALVAIDRDGAVRAMVGGRNYVSSLYNRATQAQRQPGSAFKLFVYLTALETGMTPNDTINDAPISIGGWTPRNNNGGYFGAVSIRTAFALSINTVAVRVAQQVGFGSVADMARRFGITSPITTQPSMALGSSVVRLIDMTRAYAAVGQKGVAVTPYGIRRVTTPDGTVLYQHQAEEARVLVTPAVAAEMTDLLQSAVLTGTGRAAQIGRPVAGKTGTTTSNKDGWFLGFSSGLTAGVWMGRDDARPIPGLQGGRAPARAFHDFMAAAVANRPVEQFETQAPAPTWPVDWDENFYGNQSGGGRFVDENGNPLPQPQPVPGDSDRAQQPPSPDDQSAPPDQAQPPQPPQRDRSSDALTQEWLDSAIGRRPPPQRRRQVPPREAPPPPPDRPDQRPY
jgi:penicillin-binding protein 1A